MQSMGNKAASAANGRKAQGAYSWVAGAYERGYEDMTGPEGAYATCSMAKCRAWDRCRQLMKNLGGSGLRVISKNTFFFTACFNIEGNYYLIYPTRELLVDGEGNKWPSQEAGSYEDFELIHLGDPDPFDAKAFLRLSRQLFRAGKAALIETGRVGKDEIAEAAQREIDGMDCAGLRELANELGLWAGASPMEIAGEAARAFLEGCGE